MRRIDNRTGEAAFGAAVLTLLLTTAREILAPALLLGASILVAPSVAMAHTLYVAVDGSDEGTGSEDDPFATLSGASRHAEPGDDVIVRPGVYRDRVRIEASGTLDAPISFRPEIPGTVVIAAAPDHGEESLVEIFGDHLVFEGFHVYNSGRTGITLWGTWHVTLRGNQVVGSELSGIWVGHEDPGRSGNNVIEGNLLFNNCLMNRWRDDDSGWPVALAIARSDDNVVRGNQVFKNYGEGIGVLSSYRTYIEDNLSYDNFSVMIYLDNAPETRVRGNVVGTTGDDLYFRDDEPGFGIVIANEATDVPLPSTGIVVEDNVLHGVGEVHYGEYGEQTGLHDETIEDNLVLSQWLEPADWVAARMSDSEDSED